VPALKVSVVIVAYRSGPALGRCLDSLDRDGSVDREVIVVDNGADGAEIDEARGRQQVKVVGEGTNVGFAAGCNLGASQATGDVLFFLNPDTVVEPGTLAVLGRRLEDEGVAIAMPRLRLQREPELLNSCGATIHISGMAWSSGFRAPVAFLDGPREITYANGSVLAIGRALFEDLGGFADELFTYHEDLELGWRARMRGLRIVIDPAGDVLHDYHHGRNPTKNYFMERNRLIFVSTAYSLRLLLLLSPVLVAAELGLFAVAAREGWLGDKLAGWRWCVANRRWIRLRRNLLQHERRVPDDELARWLTPAVEPAMIAVPAVVRAANPVLRGYWALVRRLL
jgi:GT2 family glycosyltransferase